MPFPQHHRSASPCVLSTQRAAREAPRARATRPPWFFVIGAVRFVRYGRVRTRVVDSFRSSADARDVALLGVENAAEAFEKPSVSDAAQSFSDLPTTRPNEVLVPSIGTRIFRDSEQKKKQARNVFLFLLPCVGYARTPGRSRRARRGRTGLAGVRVTRPGCSTFSPLEGLRKAGLD